MPTPPAPLPPSRKLLELYVEQDLTLRELGKQFGCSPSTVKNHLQKACDEHGMTWPLKSLSKARAGRTKTVGTVMLRAEIVHCIKTYRVTQIQLAEACGLQPNHLHKITSGHTQRVLLTTARKIEAGIVKVEKGKVASPTHIAPMLPLHARTHCSKGHPYGNRRNAKGQRYCPICLAEKNRRNDEKRQAERRAARRTAAA